MEKLAQNFFLFYLSTINYIYNIKIIVKIGEKVNICMTKFKTC